MKIPKFVLQTAIYERLTAGANKISCPVYSHTPDNAAYPFVQIMIPDAANDFAKKCISFDVFVRFDIWDSIGDIGGSTSRLSSIAQEIMTAITITEDATPNYLVVPGFYTISQRYEAHQEIETGTDALKHAVLDLMIQLQEV